MHAFLYNGQESKLFSDDAEYQKALKDGWTDAPGKEPEPQAIQETKKETLVMKTGKGKKPEFAGGK